MAVASISDIVTWGKISAYLGLFDIGRQKLWQGSFLNPDYPLLMEMEADILDYMNSFDPTNEDIDQVANYVYHLCGKYLAQAKVIAGQGGSGGIVNPATGVASTIQAISLAFKMGTTSSPVTVNGVSVTLPTGGDSTLILPLENILQNSIMVVKDGVQLPPLSSSSGYYYTVIYSSTQATITLGPSPYATFQNPEEYEITGLQFVNS